MAKTFEDYMAMIAVAAVIGLLFGITIRTYLEIGSEPPTWSQEKIDQCHQERKAMVVAERFVWPKYNPADKVASHLWIGNVCAAMDAKFLEENDIGLVISTAKEWNFKGEKNGVEYYTFPLSDSEAEDQSRTKSNLLLISTYIRFYLASRPGKNVLIYCNLGTGRSATAAIHAMKYMDYKEKESIHSVDYFDLVQRNRHVARINNVQSKILKEEASFITMGSQPAEKKVTITEAVELQITTAEMEVVDIPTPPAFVDPSASEPDYSHCPMWTRVNVDRPNNPSQPLHKNKPNPLRRDL